MSDQIKPTTEFDPKATDKVADQATDKADQAATASKAELNEEQLKVIAAGGGGNFSGDGLPTGVRTWNG